MGTSDGAPVGGGLGETRKWRVTRSWARMIAGATAVASLLSLAVCVALTAFVNTDRGHRYLLGVTERKASEALGVPVHVENFALNPRNLRLDLYGIQISGANPYPNPPLLLADHVEVGIRVVSIFRRAWYFDRLQIDHPVAWVVIDKNGNSNIPTLRSSGSSQSDVFDLGISHAILDRGEIYLNDRPIVLAADLHNVGFQASFDSLLTLYSGKLAYTYGQLTYGAFRPFKHNFSALFQATRSKFTVTQATVTSGASLAVVSATMTNFGNPSIQGKYHTVMDGHQVALLLDQPSIPSGVVRTEGTIKYEQEQDRSLVEGIVIDGDLSSDLLTFNTGSVRAVARKLSGHYSLANGDAVLNDLYAEVLGGELRAQGTMKAIGGESRSDVRAGLQHVSLAELRNALSRSATAKNVALNGEANATMTATWGESTSDLLVHSDATMNGQVRRSQATNLANLQGVQGKSEPQNADVSAVPVLGVIHATYTNRTNELTLNNSYLRSSQMNINVNGTVSRHSSLSVEAQAQDLGELMTVVDLFREPVNPTLDLAGSASLKGSVQGSIAEPHLEGQLSAQNLRFNGSSWKVLRAGVDLSPYRAALQNLDLESDAHGRITGSGSAGLRMWSFNQQSPFQVAMNASQIDIATLTKLAGQQIPVTGTLNAKINAHGDLSNPVGSGSVSLTRVTAYEQAISSAKMDFTGSGKQVQANFGVQLPAGEINGQMTAQPGQQTFTAQVNSKGVDLAKLQALRVRDIDAKGMLVIQANGRGTFDNPELNADLDIATLAIDGQQFDGAGLRMNVANRVANAELSSSVLRTPLHAKAQMKLDGEYMTDASLDTPTIPLQPFLAVYAPEQAAALSGQTEIHATLHGPLKNVKQLEAHVAIPLLKVGYSNTIQIAAVSPIYADYKDNVIDIRPATIRGTDTDVQLQGSIPINQGGPMSLKVQGTVDLRLAQLFDPDLRSSGQVRLNINSHGAIGSGELGGEIDLVDANLSSVGAPVGLQHANGVLKLTTDRLEISKFDGAMGGGAVTARGTILYRPRIQFDLGAAAKGVRMLYPQGLRESVDADLRLTGTSANALLGGSVHLTDLSFTPAFDLNTFLGQFSEGVTAPVGTGFEQNLRLNIAVNSASNANLVSRSLSLAGTADLQVRGTAAEPVILGRVNLSGGDVILNGDRFVLTGGTVQFINPAMTEPVLNVALTTNIREYKIDLRFDGPSDQLRTRYTSDPSLPPADIINLLAFGQTTEASAMNATPANQQAESLVASQVSSQVTSRISKAAGISQISISPVLAGGTTAGPPGANLTIQQRVTGNLFVTFSTNVATTQGQTIQGQYQVSPRVALSATRDPNGGFALDTLIKKSW